MWSNSNFIVLLVLFTFFKASFSAILLKLDDSNIGSEYTNLRTSSRHRGWLLTLSWIKKNEICKDLFSAQRFIQMHYTNPYTSQQLGTIISDGRVTKKQSKYPILVNKMAMGHGIPDAEDVFFNCEGHNFPSRKPRFSQYRISFAFQFGLYYASVLENTSSEQTRVIPKHFIGASSQYVLKKFNELEQQYLATRQRIEALEEESNDYAAVLEENDYLSKLTTEQRVLLCVSILSTSTYAEQGKEVVTEPTEGDEFEHTYMEFELAFERVKYVQKSLTTKGIFCKVHNVYSADKVTSVFITRSYDSNDSVYVSELDGGQYFLRKYFKDVPVLKGYQQIYARGTLYRNY